MSSNKCSFFNERDDILKNLRNNFSLYYDFYMVVLYGGFSNAAKELYISQSTLSRNVLKLEEQYNCELILRLQNGIQLTKTGEQIYKFLNKMIHVFNKKCIRNVKSL